MARKLPWERKAPPQTPQPPQPPESPWAFGSPDSSQTDQDRPLPPAAARLAGPAARSPSTSPPPPAPPAPPPAEEEAFMIDGLAHDDQWRMVEDELLAVARTFTAHLHAAEYQRLKALARENQSKEAAAAGPSTLTARPRAGGKAVAREDGGGGGDRHDKTAGDVPWAQTSLDGLLEGRQTLDSGRRRIAVRATGGRPGVTKAARPDVTDDEDDDEDDDDDDDLDGPAVTAPPVVQPPAKRTVSFAPRTQDVPAREPDDDDDDDDEAALSTEDDDDSDDSDDSDDLDGGRFDPLRSRRSQARARRPASTT